MVRIVDPNYETVSATCDSCGAFCTFSRIDDLRDSAPISGRWVACDTCNEKFWINGDLVSTSYEFLLSDATQHFKAKRYMPAIASLAHAWEVFFATCAQSTYVFHPFFAAPTEDRDIDELNEVFRQLHDRIADFTWAPLRSVVMHMIFDDERPTTLSEASVLIAGIPTRRQFPDTLISTVTDARRREMLQELQSLTIAKLRNNVVHKFAYRPRRTEVEVCFDEEVGVLYRVKHRLRVGDFMEHQAGAVYGEE